MRRKERIQLPETILHDHDVARLRKKRDAQAPPGQSTSLRHDEHNSLPRGPRLQTRTKNLERGAQFARTTSDAFLPDRRRAVIVGRRRHVCGALKTSSSTWSTKGMRNRERLT